MLPDTTGTETLTGTSTPGAGAGAPSAVVARRVRVMRAVRANIVATRTWTWANERAEGRSWGVQPRNGSLLCSFHSSISDRRKTKKSTRFVLRPSPCFMHVSCAASRESLSLSASPWFSDRNSVRGIEKRERRSAPKGEMGAKKERVIVRASTKKIAGEGVPCRCDSSSRLLRFSDVRRWLRRAASFSQTCDGRV